MGDDQRFQLVEFRLRCFVAGEFQRPFEVVDDGPEGAVHVVGRALKAQGLHALRIEPLAQRAQDAALADPGLTRQQHHLAFAVLRLRPPAEQQIQFLFAAHQRRQRAAAAIGIEAAFRHQSTLDPPGVNRFGDPFQVMFAKIGQSKRIADQSPGRGGDDNLVGGGQSLADARRDWACCPPPALTGPPLRLLHRRRQDRWRCRYGPRVSSVDEARLTV